MFANTYLAYETLSDGLKRLLDGLIAVNSSLKADASRTREDRVKEMKRDDAKKEYVGEHPVVRTHPETGRKALYVNVAHSVRFKRHDRSRERAAAQLSDPTPNATGVHLPFPLGGRLDRAFGTIVARNTIRSTTTTAIGVPCIALRLPAIHPANEGRAMTKAALRQIESADDDELLRSIDRWLERDVKPVVKQYDHEDRYPSRDRRADEGSWACSAQPSARPTADSDCRRAPTRRS